MFKRFHDWYLPLAREAAAANPPRVFPDPNLLVRWQWPVSYTASLNRDMGPHELVTTLALASRQWAEQQLVANTFEREDYRELTELICYFLDGAVRFTTFIIKIII